MKKSLLFSWDLLVFIMILWGCFALSAVGAGCDAQNSDTVEPDKTVSASVTILWPDEVKDDQAGNTPASIDCDKAGVDKIKILVYDSDHKCISEVASDCSRQTGDAFIVTPDTDLRFVVLALGSDVEGEDAPVLLSGETIHPGSIAADTGVTISVETEMVEPFELEKVEFTEEDSQIKVSWKTPDFATGVHDLQIHREQTYKYAEDRKLDPVDVPTELGSDNYVFKNPIAWTEYCFSISQGYLSGDISRKSAAPLCITFKSSIAKPQRVYTQLNAAGNPKVATEPDWVMVRDEHTGLVWEVKTEGGLHDIHTLYSKHNAEEIFIENLNADPEAGFNRTDWRLPSRQELFSLFFYESEKERSSINSEFFPFGNFVDESTDRATWWTSTPSVYSTKDNEEEFYGVRFRGTCTSAILHCPTHVIGDGLADVGCPTKVDPPGGASIHHVRAVRGPKKQSLLVSVKDDDVVVVDRATGLMWARRHSEPRNFTDAANSISELQGLGGYGDWRLPTVMELQSILDERYKWPTLDMTYFDADQEWRGEPFWTISEYNSGFNWTVNFGGGATNIALNDQVDVLQSFRLVRNLDGSEPVFIAAD